MRCGFTAVGINDGYDLDIERNVCFDNYSGIDFYHALLTSQNNTVKNNIIFGTSENQYPVILQSTINYIIPAKFESNYYYNPYNNLFQLIMNMKLQNFYFEDWKSMGNSGADKSSYVISGKKALYPRLFKNMTDDSIKIFPEPGLEYRNLDQISVHDSITLSPWTSIILLSNKDLSKVSDFSISGGTIDFQNKNQRDLSIAKWYQLSGINLNSPIIIRAPDGFAVSMDYEGKYFQNLSVNPVNGLINQTIYVKFNPLTKSAYYDFISNSIGALNEKIKVTGRVK